MKPAIITIANGMKQNVNITSKTRPVRKKANYMRYMQEVHEWQR